MSLVVESSSPSALTSIRGEKQIWKVKCINIADVFNGFADYSILELLLSSSTRNMHVFILSVVDYLLIGSIGLCIVLGRSLCKNCSLFFCRNLFMLCAEVYNNFQWVNWLHQ